jgi:hypothetical protein
MKLIHTPWSYAALKAMRWRVPSCFDRANKCEVRLHVFLSVYCITVLLYHSYALFVTYIGYVNMILQNLLCLLALIETDAAYVNVLTRGDLSSLRWIESHLKYFRPEDSLDKELCTVSYSALNFRDIMIATGKLPPDDVRQGLLSKFNACRRSQI